MSRLAHLSDLHFGREEPELVAQLLKDLKHVRPDLVVVSGDLTQRAKDREFRQAREFLDELPAPWLAVPGNHDIPFYDAWRRFVGPLHRYRRHIHVDADRFLATPDLAVLGLNTARSATWKEGRVSYAQIAAITRFFKSSDVGAMRVLVTHHPLLGEEGDETVRRAPLAVKAAREAGVDIFLSGHLHVAAHDTVADAAVSLRRSILGLSAGTAVSNRRRGEPNAFNVLDLGPAQATVDIHSWDGKRFVSTSRRTYDKTERTWRRVISHVSAAA